MARRGAYTAPRALVAAASRVPLNRPPARKPQAATWQADARIAAEIPELKQLIRWRGAQMAKLKLYAAALPLDAGPDAEPVPVTDEAAGIPADAAATAAEVLAEFRSRIGGQSEIQRRLETNLSKVGEAWVVYLAPRPGIPPDDAGKGGTDDEPGEWTVCSISEITYKNEHYILKRDPGVRDEQARVLVDDEDDLFRVWEPDDEWFNLADCALKGCLDAADTLALLSAQVQAEARSGTPALVFCVPNELSIQSARPTEPAVADGEPADPFQRELEEHLDGAGDPTSRKTLIPLLMRGPGEHMTPDRLRTIDLSRKPDPTVDNRLVATVLRLARGMDAPVEVLQGFMATTFNNAEAISEDTWADYLQPRATFLADAVTVGFFRGALVRAGVNPDLAERIFCWYDASDLVAQPNRENNADGAYDRNEISGAAYRQAKGFDDADAPEALEVLVRTALRRGAFTVKMLPALLQSLADEAGVVLPALDELSPRAPDASQVAAQEEQDAGVMPAMAASAGTIRDLATLLVMADRAQRGATTPAPTVAALARPRPDRGVLPGERLAAIDSELRTRLLTAANDAMTRALERAGNRLRGRTGPVADRLRLIAPRLAASTLGPALVAEAGLSAADLLEGAFEALEPDFLALGAVAQRDAAEIIAAVVGGLTSAQREILAARQASDLAGAWAWLRNTLLTLAAERLWNPDPALPAIGELDPTLAVAPGVIRSALSLAGGASGLGESGRGDGLLFRSGTNEPAGGIATGETLRDTLRDNGGQIEGWQWSYGPALRMRPFEPHVLLDGLQYTEWDDERLASEGEFGFSVYLPGDHAGDLCSAIPILLGPDESGDLVGPEVDPWGRGPNVPIPEG